jgi:tRNA G37 N-methylase TrmD
MVLAPGPFFAAVEHLYGGVDARPRTVLLTPRGRPLRQPLVAELAAKDDLLLLCGRYEGVDERVAEGLATDEVSIGDYVLAGGEVAACVLIEAVARLIPGVMGRRHDPRPGMLQSRPLLVTRLGRATTTRPAVMRQAEARFDGPFGFQGSAAAGAGEQLLDAAPLRAAGPPTPPSSDPVSRW